MGKGFPKLEFSVTTSKFGERLANWPIDALLFILSLRFFRAKSRTIIVIFHKNKFQRFLKHLNVSKILKIGYYEIFETFIYLRNL